MNDQIKHFASHASLLRDVSAVSGAPASSRLDAIVVPASRPSLQRLISLSAVLSVPLVVLCSRQAQVEKVAERVDATFGARALVVDVPGDYHLLGHDHLTSDRMFWKASAERSSDLSVKRNLGLVLARLRGWSKILFVDDDIHQLSPRAVSRLSGYLDRHPVAAMASKEFPDNSVVCHARRLAGQRQDVFVSGAVLGVNTQYEQLSFFPDIYNEDWFFFAHHAAARSLAKIGEVRQDEYDPYSDPGRAAREELGDLLAEGTYALFNSTPGWELQDQLRAVSSTRHWELFITDRRAMISETLGRLSSGKYTTGSPNSSAVHDAQTSLSCAVDQLDIITPDLCVDFIQRWREDDARWQKVIPNRGIALSESEAMNELGLTNWIACGYGAASRSSVSQGTSFRSSANRSSVRPEVPVKG